MTLHIIVSVVYGSGLSGFNRIKILGTSGMPTTMYHMANIVSCSHFQLCGNVNISISVGVVLIRPFLREERLQNIMRDCLSNNFIYFGMG